MFYGLNYPLSLTKMRVEIKGCIFGPLGTKQLTPHQHNIHNYSLTKGLKYGLINLGYWIFCMIKFLLHYP